MIKPAALIILAVMTVTVAARAESRWILIQCTPDCRPLGRHHAYDSETDCLNDLASHAMIMPGVRLRCVVKQSTSGD
jgi:hypothetical protein